ncbi:MAG: hypothetical protein EP343_13355 [Deltaproteobacteria bacterium]|nr:MAG: hypothetical protein EP343_13355 [Deltaproteobacteria bacterium]
MFKLFQRNKNKTPQTNGTNGTPKPILKEVENDGFDELKNFLTRDEEFTFTPTQAETNSSADPNGDNISQLFGSASDMGIRGQSNMEMLGLGHTKNLLQQLEERNPSPHLAEANAQRPKSKSVMEVFQTVNWERTERVEAPESTETPTMHPSRSVADVFQAVNWDRETRTVNIDSSDSGPATTAMGSETNTVDSFFSDIAW